MRLVAPVTGSAVVRLDQPLKGQGVEGHREQVALRVVAAELA